MNAELLFNRSTTIWTNTAHGDTMIRLLVANGYPICREGLKQLAIHWRNIELVGMAEDSNDVLRLAPLAI
jgi:hypothetical protein